MQLELRAFVQGNEILAEWYSHTLNMAGDVFSALNATPEVIEEQRQRFIQREIAHKNPKLPKNYLV